MAKINTIPTPPIGQENLSASFSAHVRSLTSTRAAVHGIDSGTPVNVTVKRAKTDFGLGVTKLYELIASGEVESFKVGRRRLIRYESLLRLGSAVARRAAQ
jgi:excisionase family DNA binding protein